MHDHLENRKSTQFSRRVMCAAVRICAGLCCNCPCWTQLTLILWPSFFIQVNFEGIFSDFGFYRRRSSCSLFTSIPRVRAFVLSDSGRMNRKHASWTNCVRSNAHMHIRTPDFGHAPSHASLLARRVRGRSSIIDTRRNPRIPTGVVEDLDFETSPLATYAVHDMHNYDQESAASSQVHLSSNMCADIDGYALGFSDYIEAV